VSVAPYKFRAGRTPLLVSMPHTGTYVPEHLRQRLTPAAQALPDTDWHLERLYDFLDAAGASVLVATHSRYVVDLNRPPDGSNLYPGQDTTGLVPVDTFHKQPFYLPGEEPSASETQDRIRHYWKPYHEKLATELERLRRHHGVALLWDAHSIFSVVPRFFQGRLADFNLGTAGGRSCDAFVGKGLLSLLQGDPGFTSVLDGRFKGGYITRTYGNPAGGVQAVQLELSEATYMDERAPYAFREDLAARVRPHLRALIDTFLELAVR
jgi:N-formylglutamate deformylase